MYRILSLVDAITILHIGITAFSVLLLVVRPRVVPTILLARCIRRPPPSRDEVEGSACREFGHVKVSKVLLDFSMKALLERIQIIVTLYKVTRKTEVPGVA